MSSSLTITYPNGPVEFLCPPRAAFKQLRQNFVELQSLWVETGFSTADVIGDDRGWELMTSIAKLFPRKDNPAVLGFDLDLLQTDLGQLEELFLSRDRAGIFAYRSGDTLYINLTIDDFHGCKLLEFCRYEPRMVLQDGHAAWLERKDAAEKAAAAQAEAQAEAEVQEEVVAQPPEATPIAAKRQRKAS